MDAHTKVSFWISIYDSKTHILINAMMINTIAHCEKKIISNAKRSAAKRGQYIIHS